jgi:hypothetical protein
MKMVMIKTLGFKWQQKQKVIKGIKIKKAKAIQNKKKKGK